MAGRCRAFLGVAALLAVLPGCGRMLGLVGKPRVSGVKPRVTGIDFEGIGLAFDIGVHNPYPFPLRTPRVSYGLEVEGQDLVTADQGIAVGVPARTDGTITLPVRLSYRKVWQTYKRLAEVREFGYRVHGKLAFPVVGSLVELPLSFSGRAPVLRSPKFSDLKVRFSDVSLGSAGVTVEAKVHNPNIFAIGVQNLGYQLKLGTVDVGNVVAATTGSIEPDGSGRLTLSGRISATDAIVRIIGGASPGRPKLSPVGFIDTPYGKVRLGK